MKLFKVFVIFPLIFCAVNLVVAQEKNTNARKNSVQINCLPLFFTSVNLFYERNIWRNTSLEYVFGYFNTGLIGDKKDSYTIYTSTIEFKMFMSAKKLNGFYTGAFGSFQQIYWHNGDKKMLTYPVLGATIGYQKIFKEGFVLRPFVGLGLNIPVVFPRLGINLGYAF